MPKNDPLFYKYLKDSILLQSQKAPQASLYAICTLLVQYLYVYKAYKYCTNTVQVLYNGRTGRLPGGVEAAGWGRGTGVGGAASPKMVTSRRQDIDICRCNGLCDSVMPAFWGWIDMPWPVDGEMLKMAVSCVFFCQLEKSLYLCIVVLRQI